MVHVFHHCNLFSVIEKSIKGNCIASILWWKFKKFYFETQDKVSRTEYFTQSLIKVDSIVNSLTFSKQIHAPHFILSWEFLFSYYPFQWVSYKHGRSQLLFLVDFLSVMVSTKTQPPSRSLVMVSTNSLQFLLPTNSSCHSLIALSQLIWIKLNLQEEIKLNLIAK
jgi:hypothetical protein